MSLSFNSLSIYLYNFYLLFNYTAYSIDTVYFFRQVIIIYSY